VLLGGTREMIRIKLLSSWLCNGRRRRWCRKHSDQYFDQSGFSLMLSLVIAWFRNYGSLRPVITHQPDRHNYYARHELEVRELTHQVASSTTKTLAAAIQDAHRNNAV